MVLPNFIIPGAEKGGTTPLFRLLKQHPQIHMPIQKELAFFTRMFDRREPVFYEWQVSQGYRGQRAVGEATPEYMRYPIVPKRIRALLGPGVRFIFCLRNPVTRAYSHYLQCVRMQEEGESFEQALELDETRRTRGRFINRRRAYVAGGFYSRQIASFREVFPAEQLRFVVLEEDMQVSQEKTASVLAGLLEFLDVDPGFTFDLGIKDTRLPPPVITFVGKDDTVMVPGTDKRAVPGSIVVDAFVGGAHRYIRRPSPLARRYYTRLKERLTQSLAPETAAILYERYYRDEIGRIEETIGRDLSVWRPR